MCLELLPNTVELLALLVTVIVVVVVVVVVVPCSVLIYKVFAALREVRAEQAGAATSLMMFGLFGELLAHRQLSQRVLTGDKSEEAARVQAFQRFVEQSQSLRTSLVDTQGGGDIANELQTIETEVGKLSADVGLDNLTARKS